MSEGNGNGNGRSKTLPPFEVVDMERETTPVADMDDPVRWRDCIATHKGQARILERAWDAIGALEGRIVPAVVRLEEAVTTLKARDAERGVSTRSIIVGFALLVAGAVLAKLGLK